MCLMLSDLDLPCFMHPNRLPSIKRLEMQFYVSCSYTKGTLDLNKRKDVYASSSVSSGFGVPLGLLSHSIYRSLLLTSLSLT